MPALVPGILTPRLQASQRPAQIDVGAGLCYFQSRAARRKRPNGGEWAQ
jgi:hypothetical protein